MCNALKILVLLLAVNCKAFDNYPASDFLGTNFFHQTNAPLARIAIGAIGFSDITNQPGNTANGQVLTSTNNGTGLYWSSVSSSGGGVTLGQMNAAIALVSTNEFQGAAKQATNGYVWGSLYDTANAALNATNGLGTSAFVSTNVLLAMAGNVIKGSNYLTVVDTNNIVFQAGRAISGSNYLVTVDTNNIVFQAGRAISGSNYLVTVPVGATNWIQNSALLTSNQIIAMSGSAVSGSNYLITVPISATNWITTIGTLTSNQVISMSQANSNQVINQAGIAISGSNYLTAIPNNLVTNGGTANVSINATNGLNVTNIISANSLTISNSATISGNTVLTTASTLNPANISSGTVSTGLTFSGAIAANNAANTFTGAFTGNGGGLTNFNAVPFWSGSLESGTVGHAGSGTFNYYHIDSQQTSGFSSIGPEQGSFACSVTITSISLSMSVSVPQMVSTTNMVYVLLTNGIQAAMVVLQGPVNNAAPYPNITTNIAVNVAYTGGTNLISSIITNSSVGSMNTVYLHWSLAGKFQ